MREPAEVLHQGSPPLTGYVLPCRSPVRSHVDERLSGASTSRYGAAVSDGGSDDAEVREVVRLMDDALERRDLATALSLCTEDVVFIGSGEGEQAVGQDAVVRMAMDLA